MIKRIIVFLILVVVIMFGFYCKYQFSNFLEDFNQITSVNLNEDLQWNNLTEKEGKYYITFETVTCIYNNIIFNCLYYG